VEEEWTKSGEWMAKTEGRSQDPQADWMLCYATTPSLPSFRPRKIGDDISQADAKFIEHNFQWIL